MKYNQIQQNLLIKYILNRILNKYGKYIKIKEKNKF